MDWIFIGDVHGCLNELNLLLEQMHLTGREKFVFLGDLINKGPDSLGVLSRVKELDAVYLMGNHESGFLKYIDNPGGKRRRLFEQLKVQLGDSLEEWVFWMRTFLPYYETDEFIAVHGGLHPDLIPSETEIDILTNIRTWDGHGRDMNNIGHEPWYDLYRGKKTVIYGHWAAQGLTIKGNTFGLDTGCVWGGALTAMRWSTKEVTQVSALKTYMAINNE